MGTTLRFEVVDTCFEILLFMEEDFSTLSDLAQAEAMSTKFKIKVTEQDVKSYKHELMSYAFLERQLIAEQYYGNNIQY